MQPADTLAGVDPSKQKDYYGARLAVEDLHRLGLTIVPDPNPDGPRTRAHPGTELAGVPGQQAALETGPGRVGSHRQRCYRASAELTFNQRWLSGSCHLVCWFY